MLLEVVDEDSRYSCVIKIHEGYTRYFKDRVPFETEFKVWKEEVYFNTPINIKLGSSDLKYRIELGKLYYWPPESALCLFYGVSEAYTPIAEVGTIVGPLYYLRYFKDGDHGIVKYCELPKQLTELANELSRLDYLVGAALNGDITALVATKFLSSNCRASFLIFTEDFGYHLESDAFFKLSESLCDRLLFSSMKSFVHSIARYLRLDLNEDGYVVLTAGVNELSELIKAINELEIILPLIKDRFSIYI